MASSFVSLPVPSGDGVGAWVDTSGLDPAKTITVNGGTFAGVLFVEGSNDGGVTGSPTECPILQSGTPNAIDFVSCQQFMRIRRAMSSAGPAGTPQVIVAALTASNLFSSLAVPSGDGVGASTSLAGGGLTNTFNVSGTFTGAVIIEGSNDGATWSPFLRFNSPGAQCQTFPGVLSAVRVRRQFTKGGPVPTVSFGSGAAPVAPTAQAPTTQQSQVSVSGSVAALTYGLVYPWGVTNNFNGWGTAGGATSPIDSLWCFPHLFSKSVTLKEIVMNNGISAANRVTRYSLGIYSNLGPGTTLPFPNLLLTRWVEQNPLQNGIITWPNINLAIAAGTLLWICQTQDNTPVGMNLAGLGAQLIDTTILGARDTINAGPVIGWASARVYDGVLPSPFPTAPIGTLNTSNPATNPPAFMMRFG